MDITKADIRPWDGIGMEENGNYSVGYEYWFDVDEYFGTQTRDDPDCWVNFYTEWNPKTGKVTPTVHVDTPDGIISIEKEFTPEEEAFFLKKMQDYAREGYGESLEEMYQKELN